MGERVLKMHFMGNSVDVMVADIDECLMIDVVNDMVDKFSSFGYELPTFPVLSYCSNGKSHALTDDKTLMTMFEVVESRRIDIWIGCLKQPNFIWTLAEKVRLKGSNVSGSASLPKPPITKLPVRGGKRGKPEEKNSGNLSPTPSSHGPSKIQSPEQSQTITLSSPRRSPRLMASSPSTTQESLINPPTSGVTQTGPSVGHTAPTKPNNILKPSSFPHGKKISKSTLKYKGLWVPPQPNTEANEVQKEQPFVRTRKRTRVRLDDDVGVSNVSGALFDSSGTDSEGDYQPDQGFDVDTESDDDEMEYEEGDINELLNQNYVDGGWEPFRTNE
ncbi:uncharacterized protein LOC110684924 isoform X1 [Chenopodium quinoa]|uniref:uncharacterized protein LOC110684924 isoform X1 n=1 Tax=Chenopodium quinoa TaxID=63459 RepID=UPI000B7726C3|nr:uncharacterized protein LOC110684924 isoform X1 [Chenopodium quinoa]